MGMDMIYMASTEMGSTRMELMRTAKVMPGEKKPLSKPGRGWNPPSECMRMEPILGSWMI
jgi:hypothetical protein